MNDINTITILGHSVKAVYFCFVSFTIHFSNGRNFKVDSLPRFGSPGFFYVLSILSTSSNSMIKSFPKAWDGVK